MKLSLAVLGLAFLGTGACSSVDSDILASGKIHTCELEKIKRQYVTTKDKKFLDQMEERLAILKGLEKNSGDPKAFNEAMSAVLEAGCQ